ncbi:MAG TPA: hypothetical protein VIW46_07320 [Acidimicrobiia bacterium]
MTEWRHARSEAAAVLPPGHDARVLEPSPPAALDPGWFADDPTDPSGATGTVVTPIPGEGVTWAELATADPGVAACAADHWLDGRRRLDELPDGYDAGRRALHQIAFFAVAPKRHAANGKLGLRYTDRGFGTPFFRGSDGDEQVRVEGDLLVHQTADAVRAEAVTTLRAATRFLGLDYREAWFEGFHDPLEPVGPDTHLAIDPAVTEAVASWFGFGTHVLERSRRIPGAVDVSRVQLWPEHLDAAFEMGSVDDGARAGYGASAGDGAHPEPYLYIAAWGEIDRTDPFWNDPAFNGASLDLRRLLEADDPYALALAFVEEGHCKLTS